MQQREMARQDEAARAAIEQRKQMFEARKAAADGDYGPMKMIDPELAMKLEQGSQGTGGGVEGERIANNLQRAMAAAPTPEARASLEQRAYEMQQRGLIPRVEITGPRTTPSSAASIVGQADTMDQALAATKEPKTTSDITEFEAISGMDRNDPRFGPAFGVYLEKMSKNRATQVNVGAGAQGIPEGERAKIIADIGAGNDTLAKLDDLQALATGPDGKPNYAQFLTGGARLTAAATGAAAMAPSIASAVAPGFTTPEARAQYEKQTQFEQGVKDVMLSARRAITGTGGGEREMAEIEKSLVSSKLDPVAFGAAMDRVRRMTEQANFIKQDMLAKGINVSDPRYYSELRKRWAAANPRGVGSVAPGTATPPAKPPVAAKQPPPGLTVEMAKQLFARGDINESDFKAFMATHGGQ
jgi:hypothetical protein